MSLDFLFKIAKTKYNTYVCVKHDKELRNLSLNVVWCKFPTIIDLFLPLSSFDH